MSDRFACAVCGNVAFPGAVFRGGGVTRAWCAKCARVTDHTPPFDGETYDEERDHARLAGELARVRDLMADGQWRTLMHIANSVVGSEAGVSARLRDLRKPKFGSHTVERRYVGDGLWEYRVLLRVTA